APGVSRSTIRMQDIAREAEREYAEPREKQPGRSAVVKCRYDFSEGRNLLSEGGAEGSKKERLTLFEIIWEFGQFFSRTASALGFGTKKGVPSSRKRREISAPVRRNSHATC